MVDQIPDSDEKKPKGIRGGEGEERGGVRSVVPTADGLLWSRVVIHSDLMSLADQSITCYVKRVAGQNKTRLSGFLSALQMAAD